jgi:predicted ArsR family transcriptional regulator
MIEPGLPIFDYTPPGYKDTDTSEKAARKVSGRAPMLRAKAYQILVESKEPMTADEVAARMGESVLSIRPRLSELVEAGRIKDSGQRGQNASGASAKKWEPTR